MPMSKIGSQNTYHKCLKDLDCWGYIAYRPSRNPTKGSVVYLFSFDTSTCSDSIQVGPKSDTSSKQVLNNYSRKSDTSSVEALRPSINNINNKNNKTNSKRKKREKNSPKNDLINFSMDESKESSLGSKKRKRKKIGPKKEKDFQQSLPFLSGKFTEAWNLLLQMPKWKGKQPQSLQLALRKLSRYDEEFATHLVESAIEKNWQGVVYPDTDAKYEQWKQKKSENDNQTIIGRPTNSKIVAVETSGPQRNYKERF